MHMHAYEAHAYACIWSACVGMGGGRGEGGGGGGEGGGGEGEGGGGE